MSINIEQTLKIDLKETSPRRIGFGAALIELSCAESATPEKLLKMARSHGIDLKKYEL